MKGTGAAEQGRYVYCIAKGSGQGGFGRIGIENSEVYTIASNGLSAVVHDCEAKPYASNDGETVKRWISAHHSVIERVQERFETVVPLGFDVIIKGKDPSNEVANWLGAERERLERNFEKVEGKREYAVQIMWEQAVVGKKLAGERGEIRNLVEEMENAPEGKAYFIRHKIEKALKQEMEKLADGKFREFYSGIRKHCHDIKIEKNKKTVEMQMLMNLSCLVGKGMVRRLGMELDKISKLDGFEVRFTGPWPPYSFVT